MSTHEPPRIIPLSSMGGAVIIFSAFAILVRIMDNYFLEVQQISVRLLLGGIIAGAICIFAGKNFSEVWKASKWKLSLYTIGTPLFLVFYTNAMTSTELLTAIVAFYTTSLIGAVIIGRLAFSQKIEILHIAAITIACIGLVIYSWGGDLTANKGFIFALIAGLLDAANNATKRLVKGLADRMVLVTVSLIAGGLILLVPEIISGSQWEFFSLDTTHTWHAIGWTVLYATLIATVSYLLLYGFGHLSMTTASIFLVAEIPLTGLLAWWIYEEEPTSRSIVGGIVVMIAVALASIEPRKTKKIALEGEEEIVGEIS